MTLSGSIITWKVKYEDYAYGILEIAWDETSISLLASSIPQLQTAGRGLVGDVFAQEIDAYCRLRYWYSYIVSLLEFVIDEPLNDAGFACATVTQ